MGKRARPAGVARGRPGRPSKAEAFEKLTICQGLCARARVVHGMTVLADVQQWVKAQEVWSEKFPDRGPPSDDYIASVWHALNPENVDLCANLDREKVQRTAAEERHAAIVRHRETINRWYGIERELIVERDQAEGDARRKLEERIGKAQERRLEAEAELSKCVALIDDESFESAPLRSEVIAILARNRAHFTADECVRLLAIFEMRGAGDGYEPDPDLPDYMQ